MGPGVGVKPEALRELSGADVAFEKFTQHAPLGL
jgi:hypothetical protein